MRESEGEKREGEKVGERERERVSERVQLELCETSIM